MKIKHILLIALLLFSSLFSCTGNSTNKVYTKQPGEKMTITNNQDLIDMIEALKRSMTEYMKEAKPSYTEEDIDECVNILKAYLESIAKTNSKQEGLNVVKSAVLKLNELNEKCDSELIETGEREQIAQIIILAGNKKGYNSPDEDITEEWREW